VAGVRAHQPLRVAIAGLGTMGRNHVRNVLARDDVTLVALADPTPEALSRALESSGPSVRGFANPAAMLAEEQLDALIIAVPTTQHFAVGMAAIARNVAVLIEKPIAATVVEAQHLIAAAAREGVTLQVGHVERFNPAIVALGACLRRGDLSRIHSIKTVRGGPLPDRIRDVGVAVDLATHDIDVMCNLLGERPIRVSAERSQQVHTAHEDLLYGLLAFPSGIIGQLDVNWLTPEKQRRVVVLGAEGMFTVDYLAQSLTYTRGAAVLAPSYLDGYAPTFEGESVMLQVEPSEPLRGELDAFFAAVRNKTQPVVTGEDGLMALRVAKLLLTAADEGRSLAVSLPGQA
jgi:predicted dehydrogenase